MCHQISSLTVSLGPANWITSLQISQAESYSGLSTMLSLSKGYDPAQYFRRQPQDLLTVSNLIVLLLYLTTKTENDMRQAVPYERPTLCSQSIAYDKAYFYYLRITWNRQDLGCSSSSLG